MMEPYAQFLVDFNRKHGDRTYHNSTENTRAAVIVETRPDFFLPKVIRNVMYFLGAGWNLHVLTSSQNRDFVLRALPGWDVHVDILDLPGYWFPRERYNQLLLMPSFWELFREEKILVFQTDALLAGPGIDDFLDYDLVGAPFRSFDANYLANGGLSLRNRQAMLDCLARTRPAENEWEDAFFSDGVRALGGKMPDVHEASRFSVESIYTTHPVGVHGTNQYIHHLDVARKITDAIRY